MRVLVCGSRHFKDVPLLEGVLSAFPITTIIEGEARGADLLARYYGERNGIEVLAVPADWERYGKRAGPIRNGEMLKLLPELVIAFRGPNSRGTQNMINQARKAGIRTEVIDI